MSNTNIYILISESPRQVICLDTASKATAKFGVRFGQILANKNSRELSLSESVDSTTTESSTSSSVSNDSVSDSNLSTTESAREPSNDRQTFAVVLGVSENHLYVYDETFGILPYSLEYCSKTLKQDFDLTKNAYSKEELSKVISFVDEEQDKNSEKTSDQSNDQQRLIIRYFINSYMFNRRIPPLSDDEQKQLNDYKNKFINRRDQQYWPYRRPFAQSLMRVVNSQNSTELHAESEKLQKIIPFNKP